jgi:CelD/BcsL family acetyltransferase involved in cellulose biosynthesis
VSRAGRSSWLTSTTITSLDELRGLRAEWDALLAEVESATVFQSWDWVAAWFTAFARHQSVRVLLLRDADGQLVGVAPGALTVGPLGIRTVGLLGRGKYLAEYGDAVIHPAFAEEAAAAIAEAWDQGANAWDRLILHNISPDGPLNRAAELLVSRGYRRIVTHHNAAVRGRLPATWAAFHRSLRKSMRDNVNNYVNRLCRDGHRVRLMLATAATLDQYLDCLFSLHRLRANSPLRPKHDDYFAAVDKRRFVRDVARPLLESGRLELAVLEVDGVRVAAQLCLRQGTRFSPYYSGYDPAWAHHGVMTVLTRYCIELAIERGCQDLDMLCGATHEKLRWGGKPVPLVSAVVVGRRLGSRAKVRAYNLHWRCRVFLWRAVQARAFNRWLAAVSGGSSG